MEGYYSPEVLERLQVGILYLFSECKDVILISFSKLTALGIVEHFYTPSYTQGSFSVHLDEEGAKSGILTQSSLQHTISGAFVWEHCFEYKYSGLQFVPLYL